MADELDVTQQVRVRSCTLHRVNGRWIAKIAFDVPGQRGYADAETRAQDRLILTSFAYAPSFEEWLLIAKMLIANKVQAGWRADYAQRVASELKQFELKLHEVMG